MKKLLTILVLIPCFCFGQKRDSLTDRTGDFMIGLPVINAPTSAGIIMIEHGGYSIPKDTIPVIMLVCDTSFVTFSSSLDVHESKDSIKTLYHIDNRVPHVWWQFGYEVSESKWYDQIIEDRGESILVTPAGYKEGLISYLDKDKKPLPKSIIVWMVKEIK